MFLGGQGSLQAALLLGHLVGSALGAGALLSGRAAAAHLDGGEGANALGAVVVGAAGDGTLDVVVGVHRVEFMGWTSFSKSATSMAQRFFHYAWGQRHFFGIEWVGGEVTWIYATIKLPYRSCWPIPGPGSAGPAVPPGD